MRLKIIAPQELNAKVSLPPSKSIQSRLLMLQALSGKALTPLPGSCTDIQVLSQALSSEEKTINVKDSGTALRFLTAYFATKNSEHVITGSERLCQRPVKPLVDALRQLGACVEYLGEEGYAPLKVRGGKLRGGRVEIDASESSQYISALMLISPFVDGGIEIVQTGKKVSSPYIDMTAAILNSLNSSSSLNSLNYEGDWTAASYWHEMMILSGGKVEFTNLNPTSCQGDVIVPELFRRIQEDADFQFDFTDNPDLFPAVAATCFALKKTFHYTGVSNLRIKESDRVATINAELGKIRRGELVVSSHNDHRIAMALAPLAFLLPHIIIDGAEATEKSYPHFWLDLQSAGFLITTILPSDH